MKNVIVFSLLLGVIAITACGEARLSADEYGEACGQLASDLQDTPDFFSTTSGDLDNIFEEFQDAVEDYKDLSPPDEFERLHELNVQMAELLIEVTGETGILDLLKDLRDLEEEFEDLDADEQLEILAGMEEEWTDRMDAIDEKFKEYEVQLEELGEDIDAAEEDLHPDDYEILADNGCLSIF